jgi:hypothetical protein
MMPNKETMDLSTYSVALYGKTWYEMNWTAEPKNPYNEYRNPNEYNAQVEYYVSVEAKISMEWMYMMVELAIAPSYTSDLLNTHAKYIKEVYDTTTTFPEFFRKISTIIPIENRIHFFQHWLVSFINRYITFDNIWIVTL